MEGAVWGYGCYGMGVGSCYYPGEVIVAWIRVVAADRERGDSSGGFLERRVGSLWWWTGYVVHVCASGVGGLERSKMTSTSLAGRTSWVWEPLTEKGNRSGDRFCWKWEVESHELFLDILNLRDFCSIFLPLLRWDLKLIYSIDENLWLSIWSLWSPHPGCSASVQIWEGLFQGFGGQPHLTSKAIYDMDSLHL